jgi:NAD(P)-dependent dehydrogenase (short-subunit alcohol dehydrogenase family)
LARLLRGSENTFGTKETDMAGKLDGRRILITGAASGIGRGVAELFSAEGAALALVDRNAQGVAETADRLGALGYRCDVSSLTEVEQTVRAAADGMGGLDGIVNAAGVLFIKMFEDLAPEDFAAMLAVNLTAPFNIIRVALPDLRQAPRATIVNIASVSGYMPMPGSSGYSATKAGLIMLTKCLALELGPNIRVNAICPGVVRTEMTRYILENPEHAEQAAARTALKRVGEPQDVAQAALFLSTEDAGFTTGSEITVDGGFSWR